MFISNAYAEAAATSTSPGLIEFLPLVGLAAVFYFLILRPQQKRSKEQKTMLGGLQKGDEVVTSGGALGRVTKIGDNYVSVEIADNVTVQFQKSTIQTVLPKGTIKSI